MDQSQASGTLKSCHVVTGPHHQNGFIRLALPAPQSLPKILQLKHALSACCRATRLSAETNVAENLSQNLYRDYIAGSQLLAELSN